MKVIKRIRRETLQQKINNFYLETGVVTRAILLLYGLLSLILALTSTDYNYSFLGLFSMRATEILFFLLVGASDLRREERKGSFFLLLTFLLKNLLVWGAQKTMAVFVNKWPSLDTFSLTAIPIQYLFLIAVEEAFANPGSLKHLFIEPFQVKAKFYPLLLFLILMVASLRVDLVVPFFLALAVHFGRVNVVSQMVASKFNEKCLGERLAALGFLREGASRKPKPLDELATNDSIFLEEK